MFLVDIVNLNHKDLIALAIFSGVPEAEAICRKLNQLGVPLSENTVRARLSEMLREGLIRNLESPHGYSLTRRGEDSVTQITPTLTDEQLEILA